MPTISEFANNIILGSTLYPPIQVSKWSKLLYSSHGEEKRIPVHQNATPENRESS